MFLSEEGEVAAASADGGGELGGGDPAAGDVPHAAAHERGAEAKAHGWSAEELTYQHPHLTLGRVYSALAYHSDHRDEVDADLARRAAFVEEVTHRGRRPSARRQAVSAGAALSMTVGLSFDHDVSRVITQGLRLRRTGAVLAARSPACAAKIASLGLIETIVRRRLVSCRS